MEIKHLEITTVRPFTQAKHEVDGKVNYKGFEVIAYTPTKRKVKFTSTLMYALPLVNAKKQNKAMVEDVYSQVIVKEKALQKFYDGIAKMENSQKTK
jgi:hypothetical protein